MFSVAFRLGGAALFCCVLVSRAIGADIFLNPPDKIYLNGPADPNSLLGRTVASPSGGWLTGQSIQLVVPASGTQGFQVVNPATQKPLFEVGSNFMLLMGDLRLQPYSVSNAAGTAYMGPRDQSGVNNLDFILRTQSAGTFKNTMILKSSGFVGVGNTAPSTRLTVGANTTADEIVTVQSQGVAGLELLGDTADTTGEVGGAYVLMAQDGGGVYGIVGMSQKAGYDPRGTTFPYTDALSNSLLLATKTPSGSVQIGTYGTVRMTVSPSGNVGIGTTSPSHKLAVNGTIRAKEVIVESGWADYVFAPDYQLEPLDQVESHIKEHGHLPGIPSAADVAARGVNIGEMQARLLAKIEELTLHVIAQGKEIDAQRSRLAQLAQENETLKRRFPSEENESVR